MDIKKFKELVDKAEELRDIISGYENELEEITEQIDAFENDAIYLIIRSDYINSIPKYKKDYILPSNYQDFLDKIILVTKSEDHQRIQDGFTYYLKDYGYIHMDAIADDDDIVIGTEDVAETIIEFLSEHPHFNF